MKIAHSFSPQYENHVDLENFLDFMCQLFEVARVKNGWPITFLHCGGSGEESPILIFDKLSNTTKNLSFFEFITYRIDYSLWKWIIFLTVWNSSFRFCYISSEPSGQNPSGNPRAKSYRAYKAKRWMVILK